MLLACGCTDGVPRDENGYPVIRSRQIKSLGFTNFVVDTLYYTVTSNIADRGSSLFVADSPTARQAIRFATTTPVYCFIIHTNRDDAGIRRVTALVTLEQHPRDKPHQDFVFRITRSTRQPSTIIPLRYGKMVPDLRAYELIKGRWDPAAVMTVTNGEPLFVFMGETNRLLLFSTVLKDLRDLVLRDRLYEEKD